MSSGQSQRSWHCNDGRGCAIRTASASRGTCARWRVTRLAVALPLALTIGACGGSSQGSTRPLAPSRDSALPLAPTPAKALTTCLRITIMRGVCPRRVPLVSGSPAAIAAACFDSGGARVPLRSKQCRTAGWSLMGKPPKPAAIGHIVISASLDDRQCTWPHERRAHAVSNRLLNPNRRRAVSLGKVDWDRQSGQLVLAPPFSKGGGVVGDHLEFCFRTEDVNYAITLHASWKPLAEVVATLKSLVGSALHRSARR